MKDAKFFTCPVHDWQRRYEALRASFVERLPARVVGERFHYSPAYVRLMRHQFMQGKIDFAEPVPEGKIRRRRVDPAIREKIRDWRGQKLSAGEITECLSEDGHEISVRTVERVLREEGLWRRIRTGKTLGQVRQVVVRGNGREKPAFMITNDRQMPLELIVGHYARRWRVENGIAEAVKFFHLNSLSSPILIKVHFDVLMTMTADTLYSMLAHKLRGFEDCDASTIYRHFVRGKGTITVDGGTVNVLYPRRAHNPILRAVPWDKLPGSPPAFDRARLGLSFQ